MKAATPSTPSESYAVVHEVPVTAHLHHERSVHCWCTPGLVRDGDGLVVRHRTLVAWMTGSPV